LFFCGLSGPKKLQLPGAWSVMVKRPLLVCGTVPAKQCTANGHWAHWAPFFSNEKVRNHHEINQQIVILMAFHGGFMGFYGLTNMEIENQPNW